jgi:hypothetical protein
LNGVSACGPRAAGRPRASSGGQTLSNLFVRQRRNQMSRTITDEGVADHDRYTNAVAILDHGIVAECIHIAFSLRHAITSEEN